VKNCEELFRGKIFCFILLARSCFHYSCVTPIFVRFLSLTKKLAAVSPFSCGRLGGRIASFLQTFGNAIPRICTTIWWENSASRFEAKQVCSLLIDLWGLKGHGNN
jgi:hypothetical protein